MSITWPVRHRLLQNTILGTFRRWRSKCKRFQIDMYVDGSGLFLAQERHCDDCDAWTLIDRNRTLNAAKKSCQAVADFEASIIDDPQPTKEKHAKHLRGIGAAFE